MEITTNKAMTLGLIARSNKCVDMRLSYVIDKNRQEKIETVNLLFIENFKHIHGIDGKFGLEDIDIRRQLPVPYIQ